MPRATTLRMYMFHQLWHDVHAFSKTSLIYYVKKLCIYSDVQCMFLVFHEVRIKFNGCLSVQILFGVPDTMSFPFTLYTDNVIIFK